MLFVLPEDIGRLRWGDFVGSCLCLMAFVFAVCTDYIDNLLFRPRKRKRVACNTVVRNLDYYR